MSYENVKNNQAASACVEEVIAVLAKHGFTLSHEDSQGAFILEPRTEKNVTVNEEWLRQAFFEEKALG